MENESSIEGTLLMLDGTTPHVAVPVQAICDEEVVATTLSDEGGRYRFINLRPGRYQVRCQILHGHVYYGEEKTREPESQKARRSEHKPIGLQVERGKALRNIDFRFAPFKKGIWKNYNTLNGLAHNDVQTMYVDPDGVMWFATLGGVSHYDGKEFVTFTTRDGLPSNKVFTVCGDLDGAIWFGTYGAGVCRYDGNEFLTLTEEDGLAGNIVKSAACGPDGDLWFGTHSGVSRYDGRGFITFTEEDGLAHNAIHGDAIHCDPDGIVWFGTGRGLSRYDGKEFTTLSFDNGSDGNWNFIHSVCRDRDGLLWVGTRSGVVRYDGRDFVRFTTRDGLPSGFVLAIHQDLDGSMWFGMAWSGSHSSRYDGKTFINFTKEDGLVDSDVCAIHSDPDGTIWFATDGSGVSQYNENEIAIFTIRDGLAGNQVNAVHRDFDGNMWIGTPDGVSLYNGKQFTNYTQDGGLAHNDVISICQGLDHVMWFGTAWWGIYLYDGKQFIGLEIEGEWQHSRINAIHRAPDGAMWVGTGIGRIGNLIRYDGKIPVSFTKEHGLIDDWVLSIHIGDDGVAWIGTSVGLSRYDGKEFVNFTTEDGLVDNYVTTIHREPDSVMWFGSSCGISRYDGRGMDDCPRFTNFTTDDGLAHNSVISIYSASDGSLWFGTDGGGVSVYDGTAWSSLDTRDGLGSNTVYAIDQDPDGNMWFGTGGGLVRYRRDLTPAHVHIVSVTVDKTYRDLSNIPTLIIGQRVTIEYAALDLKTITEKQQYRCRIREIDRDWREPTKATSLDHTFDKPGEYTFEVQSIDRDLNYSEPAILSLAVQPDPVLAELNYLRQETSGKYRFDSIIGSSDVIKLVRALMERAIDSRLKQVVLVTGETGTGKELVAKAIHYNGLRKDKPLRDRNCGAIPKDLLASDLFGHRKGAFTGATEDKIGLFEAASGGTLLLDEIGEMPQDAQVHLLRVLQENKIQRLGENISRDVDVQIIAMTNRDLVEDVAAGRFREDLYYRLSEFPIHIPPLRERVEDVPLLAEHFLQETDREFGGFAPGVLEVLQNYSWPGNVRELRNAIRRAVVLAEEGQYIQAYHFPSQITHEESLVQDILSNRVKYSESVDRFRRRLIVEALRQSDGNRNEAARRLGMDRSNLRALIKRLGISL